MKKKLLFVHLLNNYTGSPNVLSSLLSSSELLNTNDVYLLTSNSKGPLSFDRDIKFVNNYYKWSDNKIVLLFNLIKSHIFQFFYILFGPKFDLVYINTILPFAAAFAARIRRIKVIYHVHEYYPKANIMQRICVYVLKRLDCKKIFVSQYLKISYENDGIFEGDVVYNPVSNIFETFFDTKTFNDSYLYNRYNLKKIIMPCSLKIYKGIPEFFLIAEKMPEFNFCLVLSCSEAKATNFLGQYAIPQNVTIKYNIMNMVDEYASCSLCINLSHSYGDDIFIETFGMTLIEAQSLAIPVIAPAVGGPLEIISNGLNGFFANPFNFEEIIELINKIFLNYETYSLLCKNAYKNSKRFNQSIFQKSIIDIINEK